MKGVRVETGLLVNNFDVVRFIVGAFGSPRNALVVASINAMPRVLLESPQVARGSQRDATGVVAETQQSVDVASQTRTTQLSRVLA